MNNQIETRQENNTLNDDTYYKKNKHIIKERSRLWKEKNRDAYLTYMKKYSAKRRQQAKEKELTQEIIA